MVVVCPWGFLGGSANTQQQQKEAPLADVINTSSSSRLVSTQQAIAQAQSNSTITSEQQNKTSYADIAKKRGSPQVEFAELPTPGHKGEYPSIKISKSAYERGLDYCKHSLLARFDLNKMSIEELRTEAALKWNPTGEWVITPIGKGYLFLRFDNASDFNKVWGGGPWNFEGQILRLSKWEKNFIPENQKQTHAYVWIKFPGLPMEYWEEETVMSLGRSVGYPIQVDENTLKKTYGYYARVLVDIDLANSIPEQVFVEAIGTEFWQTIQVGKLPKFYNHCKIVGHLVTDCRKLKSDISLEKNKTVVVDNTPRDAEGQNKKKNKKKRVEEPRNKWIEVTNGKASTSVDIENNNHFQVLQESDGGNMGTLENQEVNIAAGQETVLPLKVVAETFSGEGELGATQGMTSPPAVVERPPVHLSSDRFQSTPFEVRPSIALAYTSPDKDVNPVNAAFEAVTLIETPNIGSSTSISRTSLPIGNVVMESPMNSRRCNPSSVAEVIVSPVTQEPTSNFMSHFIALNEEAIGVQNMDSRVLDSYSSSTTTAKSPCSSSEARLRVINETKSILRYVNWEDFADDEDNSDGEVQWQVQKKKGRKPKEKDVDLPPLPPRARNIPARYK